MNNTLILNSSNKINEYTYEYKFPTTVKFTSYDKISLQSLSIYHSIFNIEAIRGNNKISVKWVDGITYNLKIEDGNYDIVGLNYQLQSFCILNDLYMIDDVGKYIYYLELMTNPSRYAGQLNAVPVPTSAQASALGYTIPAGASWSSPVTAVCPQFIIPEGAFGDLIGFSVGSYPPIDTETVEQKYLSSKTPQIAPVNSILLGCNLINGQYSNPSHIFASIPLSAGFGSLIEHNSTSPIMNSISSGSYQMLRIQFYDQLYNSLRLHDDEIVLIMNIQTNEVPINK